MNIDLVATVKEYLRVDGAEDDKFLGFLIDSAKEYLSNAGVKEKSESKQYQLAIIMLVTHWYENREQNQYGKISSAIEHGLQTIILQLKAGGLSESSKV